MATKILIVDDDAVIRVLFQRYLEREGCQVLTAEDGELGLELARREIPDVILMDIMLPRTGGLEVIRQLKRTEATKNIPVVTISSRDHPSVQEEAILSGASGTMTKPFSPAQLLAKVQQLTARMPTPVAPPQPPPDTAAASAETKTILMLEDDLVLAELVHTFLQSQGYRVTRVVHGADGLREVLVRDFDVILCDLLMPELPGDKFHRAVQRVKPHLCQRFIFVTGQKEDPRWQEFLRPLNAIVIWKPFPLEELQSAIEKVLSAQETVEIAASR